jgi:hypothetical protein
LAIIKGKRKKRKHVCFECEKEINERPYIIAIDVPYINLKFHKECFKKIRGSGNEQKYLEDNIKKIYEYAKKYGNL